MDRLEAFDSHLNCALKVKSAAKHQQPERQLECLRAYVDGKARHAGDPHCDTFQKILEP